jgi:hypothetical protein
MKIFFGVDITTNKENDRMDGENFIIDRVSNSQEKALDQNSEAMMALQNKANLPLPLRILHYISAFVCLCFIVGIIRGLGKVTLAEAFQNAPWIFYILPVSAIIWVALTLLRRKHQKDFNESPELEQASKRSQMLNQQSYDSLGVPADADTMDVLCSRYIVKKGEPVNRPFGPYTFIATEVKIYTEGEVLVLADVHQKFSIPLSSLTGLRTIQKPVTLPVWNKDAYVDQPPYDQYHITINQNGVNFKPYHALLIRDDEGEAYELYFPSYELPVIERLTGLHVTH